MISGGAALAEPLPITALPLQAEGENRWMLPAGAYSGQFLIDQPMAMRGHGHGHVLTVRAPAVPMEGSQVREPGRDLPNMNAGIFVEPTANGAVIRNHDLRGAGFGIWVELNRDVLIAGNRIEGEPSL